MDDQSSSDDHDRPTAVVSPPGIEAESLPLMDFVDSCTESCSNSEIFDISPQEFKMEEQEVDEDEEEEEVQELDKKEKNIKQQDFKKPSSFTELRTPGGRRRTPESPRNLFVRKIPDFSKVAPRVLFPKDNVLRSVSKRPPVWDSLSPDFPQNPAAFARDVLLNTIDGASNIKVQQAIALVEQLQENYDRLLTKHAEAENTIDRLRVGAKVNLFSELPKPSPVVQSGLNFNPSKLVTLDFPRAQRVELHSDSPQANEQEMNFSKGTQITPEVLRSQAEKFFHQLYSFEEILKNDSCQPVKQIKGLLQVVEELNSLERGYLLAMDEDALRQQRGEETNPFDRERDLEQLIGRFRLHVEGLKEQVEEMLVEESKCEATQSSPPQPPPLSVPSEEEDDEEVEEEEGQESDRHPKVPSPVRLPQSGMSIRLFVCQVILDLPFKKKTCKEFQVLEESCY
ncbi:AT-hook-containing transcription factor isoform X2 [Cynoglossus semilaevis]|uniref:AT-hook-containing transcription factor isoform X2 n=1 Tax=Cynoglossus semilaevis TaxID=244447 RepID=UPI0007DCAB5C|nr:AT-hook-containing transcription factor-like isoform X2 [Cynoglossus semilaevis]